jgi:hypothetical protein
MEVPSQAQLGPGRLLHATFSTQPPGREFFAGNSGTASNYRPGPLVSSTASQFFAASMTLG